MSNNEVKVKSSGMGIGTILFLIFMTLKLTGDIDWSWWWVTAPLWIPLVGFLAFAGIAVVIAIIIAYIGYKRNQ
jgi:hypothetical protein